MPLHPEIDLSIKLEKITGNHEYDRNALRKLLLDFLIREKPGTGNKENTSTYRYNVEDLFCDNRIYLTRPVVLNKGFDFVIHVENYTFLNGKDNPRHEDVLKDLKIKKQENTDMCKRLLTCIDLVYFCHDPIDIFSEQSIIFERGLPVDLVLKVIKWLFIEQDVRYWNWSGRSMFLSGIKEL